jgi:hypothetical protein
LRTGPVLAVEFGFLAAGVDAPQGRARDVVFVHSVDVVEYRMQWVEFALPEQAQGFVAVELAPARCSASVIALSVAVVSSPIACAFVPRSLSASL